MNKLDTKEINDIVNNKIRSILSKEDNSSTINESIKYVSISNGKMIRPFIVHAISKKLGYQKSIVENFATALELIHCYSLVHDDLPAMDNDSFRRGRLSCHKKFNEATAILTGDALLICGFELLSDINLKIDKKEQLEIINICTKKLGKSGMIFGQLLDIQGDENKDSIKIIHANKTAVMFELSFLLGYYSGNVRDNKLLKLLLDYGHNYGMIYQLIDDFYDQNKEENYNFFKLYGQKIGMQQLELLKNELKYIISKIEKLNKSVSIFLYDLLNSITDNIKH